MNDKKFTSQLGNNNTEEAELLDIKKEEDQKHLEQAENRRKIAEYEKLIAEFDTIESKQASNTPLTSREKNLLANPDKNKNYMEQKLASYRAKVKKVRKDLLDLQKDASNIRASVKSKVGNPVSQSLKIFKYFNNKIIRL